MHNEGSVKATRATVQIGSFAVDGFMLPDGSYKMSLTQAAEIVGLGVQNASDFLRSKTLKSLLGESYTPQIYEIEPEDQLRGQSRIRALPLEIVRKYWLWQAYRGNKQAMALVDALMAETLERRFDQAFGVSRSEEERNERLSERLVEQLETDLRAAFDYSTATQAENDYLIGLLRQHGIDPWALPGEDSAQSSS
ncbi:MAG: hypothetical protein ACKO7W_08605 [Elainella sp.]